MANWLNKLRSCLSQAHSRLSGPVLCSNCFSDHGLQIEAISIGHSDFRKCPNCQSKEGTKLYQSDLEQLLVEFFWNGSLLRTEFGGASRLVSNPERYGEREVDFPSWLKADAQLLEDRLRVGIFHYGPPLWRIGMIDPLIDLLDRRTRYQAAKMVVSSFPSVVLESGTPFYRIRTNLDQNEEMDRYQYDAAPKDHRGYGRLDSKSLPVLYGSEDLEICLHECRITIPDECFVATLRANHDLQMLNLMVEPQEDGPTEFESLGLALRYLFAAEPHSYAITRAIARAAKKHGYDGIYYPSYFSLVKPRTVPNIAIFGYPISQKKIELTSINRAMLKSASLEVRMGPLFSS